MLYAEAVQKNGAQILKEGYGYMASLQKYAFSAYVSNEVKDEGKSVTFKRVTKGFVHRPDSFLLDSTGDIANRRIYLHNGVLTIAEKSGTYYAQKNTHRDIDGTIDLLIKKLDVVLPVTTLLHSKMNKIIKPKKVHYFGKQKIGDVMCNYVAFRYRGATVHL